MPAFKLVIGGNEGKSVQRELNDPDASSLLGKKLGERINGELLGLQGYEFQIAGGSDNAGFPMRRDVDGINRKKIFTVQGTGVIKSAKGIRQKKTVAGNTINVNTVQINLKIIKQGKEELFIKTAETPKPAVA